MTTEILDDISYLPITTGNNNGYYDNRAHLLFPLCSESRASSGLTSGKT
jgi:hypothetical protein